MRWLVDENLPKGLVDWLRQRGDDVLDVADSRYRSQSDRQLWRLAGEDARAVITRDLGFPSRAGPPSPVGVVLVRVPDNWRARQILDLVRRGTAQLAPGELAGQVTVLEPGRTRQHALAGLGWFGRACDETEE